MRCEALRCAAIRFLVLNHSICQYFCAIWSESDYTNKSIAACNKMSTWILCDALCRWKIKGNSQQMMQRNFKFFLENILATNLKCQIFQWKYFQAICWFFKKKKTKSKYDHKKNIDFPTNIHDSNRIWNWNVVNLHLSPCWNHFRHVSIHVCTWTWFRCVASHHMWVHLC